MERNKESFANKVGLTVDDLSNININDIDRFSHDSALMLRHPF